MTDPLVCSEAHCDDVSSLKEKLPTVQTLTQAADLFKLLADPTRLRIVSALLEKELCVCEICDLLEVSQSAVSHQLRLLRGGQLVKPRREGKQIFYSLDDRHVLNIVAQGLEHVSHSRKEEGYDE